MKQTDKKFISIFKAVEGALLQDFTLHISIAKHAQIYNTSSQSVPHLKKCNKSKYSVLGPGPLDLASTIRQSVTSAAKEATGTPL